MVNTYAGLVVLLPAVSVIMAVVAPTCGNRYPAITRSCLVVRAQVHNPAGYTPQPV